MLLQQHFVGASGKIIDRVVSAHHRLHLGLGNSHAKRRQVSFFKVARRGFHIDRMPRRLRPRMHREMFTGRYRAQVIHIRPLHSLNERAAQPPGQERIFSISLLPAPPPRITKNIDVGRPESQPKKDAVIPFALRLVVFSPRFIAHVSPIMCTAAGSHVAAMPIACGNTVTEPARATPCSASFQVW